MSRPSDRAPDEMRPVSLTIGASKHAEGSCLIAVGDTQVMCTASVEDKVPLWVKGTGQGWVTAEYGMLPRSTSQRMERESRKGQTGRTHEIQRLIGRALRAGVDLSAMPDVNIKIDCDVIQADGGTRTAAVTGGFVALYLALRKLVEQGKIKKMPVVRFIAAVSCGIVGGAPALDLDYHEDATADTDANFVMADAGKIVEVQGCAEHAPFTPAELTALMDLARAGCDALIRKQKEALGAG